MTIDRYTLAATAEECEWRLLRIARISVARAWLEDAKREDASDPAGRVESTRTMLKRPTQSQRVYFETCCRRHIEHVRRSASNQGPLDALR